MDAEEEAIPLAPLEELLALVPQIEAAKQRARLGSALQKATIAAERFADLPDRLADLRVLANEARTELGETSDLLEALSPVAQMARVLAGQPSAEDLDRANQTGLTELPLRFSRIDDRVESAWRGAVRKALGNQAALGQVLLAIPGVETLGRELTHLSEAAVALEDRSKLASWRIAERDRLVSESTAVTARLQAAGIDPNVAAFLVAVAAGPVRLSDLEDGVHLWLKGHGATSMFEVSARG